MKIRKAVFPVAGLGTRVLPATKAIWDYLDILVNDNRMARGREILAQYKAQFDAVEKAYGVDRYIIASIWGIESNYSTQMGDRSVLQSTATLACVGRRQK